MENKWKKGDKLRVINSSGTDILHKGDIVEFDYYERRDDDSDYVSCYIIKNEESIGGWNVNRFELVESKYNEIDKKLKEAMELCIKKGIIGKSADIDGYYITFEFRKLKPKCKECGREGE